MFSEEPRCKYEKNQLADVICQLRFPEILSINTTAPADFQELIRSEYPKYILREEAPNPKNGQHVKNYSFSTMDGIYRVNLTSSFISLSCNRYTAWEDFAQRLDGPLAAFIKTYSPACFERIGLRYLNFVSKRDLDLKDYNFRDLFSEKYTGILSDEDIAENTVARSSVDADLAIRGGCRAKIHAGPGMVQRMGVKDDEPKFVIDMDLYMAGNIPVNYSAAALETVHGQAYPIFRDIITDTLHNAMEPTAI